MLFWHANTNLPMDMKTKWENYLKYILIVLAACLWGTSVTAQGTSADKKAASASSVNEKTVWAINRLYQLHYWTGRTYSLKDDANRQAIVAFQKVTDLPRTGRLDDSTVAALERASVPEAHDKMHAQHLEVDLDRQVMFVVDPNDQVNRVLSVSTGSGERFDDPDKGDEYARTPRGTFRIESKVDGWKESPLGLMYDPMYFSGGYAVHGDNSVPTHPASHGCVRIPMFAIQEMFRVTEVGTPVVVYGENPKPKHERRA